MTAMATITLVKLGPLVTARISARRTMGNDRVASVMRIRTVSTRPR
jgi:hypothetical protein